MNEVVIKEKTKFDWEIYHIWCTHMMRIFTYWWFYQSGMPRSSFSVIGEPQNNLKGALTPIFINVIEHTKKISHSFGHFCSSILQSEDRAHSNFERFAQYLILEIWEQKNILWKVVFNNNCLSSIDTTIIILFRLLKGKMCTVLNLDS